MGVETNPDFSSNIVYNPVDFAYDHTLNNSTTYNISPGSNSDSPNFSFNRTTRNRHKNKRQRRCSIWYGGLVWRD